MTTNKTVELAAVIQLHPQPTIAETVWIGTDKDPERETDPPPPGADTVVEKLVGEDRRVIQR